MLFRIHGNSGDDVVMRPTFTLMTKPISVIARFIGNIYNIITIIFRIANIHFISGHGQRYGHNRDRCWRYSVTEQ